MIKHTDLDHAVGGTFGLEDDVVELRFLEKSIRMDVVGEQEMPEPGVNWIGVDRPRARAAGAYVGDGELR